MKTLTAFLNLPGLKSFSIFFTALFAFCLLDCRLSDGQMYRGSVSPAPLDQVYKFSEPQNEPELELQNWMLDFAARENVMFSLIEPQNDPEFKLQSWMTDFSSPENIEYGTGMLSDRPGSEQLSAVPGKTSLLLTIRKEARLMMPGR